MLARRQYSSRSLLPLPVTTSSSVVLCGDEDRPSSGRTGMCLAFVPYLGGVPGAAAGCGADDDGCEGDLDGAGGAGGVGRA